MELLAHIVVFAFAVFIAVSAVPGSSLFSWHPTCMALAVFLWTESIISFRKPKPGLRVNIHWAINATAMTLAIIGFLAIYRNKESSGKPHFTTPHGIAGAATLTLLLIQTIGGNFANFSSVLAKMVPAIKPALIKWGHRLSGAVSLTFVYLTVIGGLGSFWFSTIVESALIWWGIVLCLVYSYLYAVFNANYAKPTGKSKN